MRTLKEIVIDIVGEGVTMRQAQKNFFKEKSNPKLRSEYLKESIASEKKFDRLLDELSKAVDHEEAKPEKSQPALFS